MTDLPVSEQEIVAHVILGANRSPVLVRELWSRLRQKFDAAEPIGRTPGVTDLPAEFPSGSVLVAAQESRDRGVQMLLRREDDVLVLSVLLAASDGLSWTNLDQRLDEVLSGISDEDGMVGLARVYLGKVADPAATVEIPASALSDLPAAAGAGDDVPGRTHRTASGLLVWESASAADDRADRRIVVLAAPEGDRDLTDWTWSPDGAPSIPPFTRYLVQLAKVRHQLRFWSTLPDVARLTASVDDAVRRHQTGDPEAPDALTGVRAGLGDATYRRHTLRLTLRNCWDNAADVLPVDPAARNDPLAVDRRLVDGSLLRLISELDFVANLEHRVHGAALTVRRERGSARSPAAPPARRVLVICDEWAPRRGPLALVNRHLCRALAEVGAEVCCLGPASTEAEAADALGAGIRLLNARPVSGGSVHEALARPPVLPDGFVPDVLVGYGRVTGRAALSQAEDNFPAATRLHVVLHGPRQVDPQRVDVDDSAASPEDREEEELALACQAGGVLALGPAVYARLQRDLPAEGGPLPVQFDPGFDGTAVVPAPRGRPQILLLGGIDDDPADGFETALRAVGKAARLYDAEWDLVVWDGGASPSDRLGAILADRTAGTRVQASVSPLGFDGLPRLLRRSSLVLAPARVEGVNIVGAEALAAGMPVLLGYPGGLGTLVDDLIGRRSSELALPVDGVDAVDRWVNHIGVVLRDVGIAFERAAQLREQLARHRTWADAAAQLLRAAGARSA